MNPKTILITTDLHVSSIKIKRIKLGMSTITASHKLVVEDEEKASINNITVGVFKIESSQGSSLGLNDQTSIGKFVKH